MDLGLRMKEGRTTVFSAYFPPLTFILDDVLLPFTLRDYGIFFQTNERYNSHKKRPLP